jgi:hypothetical protein
MKNFKIKVTRTFEQEFEIPAETHEESINMARKGINQAGWVDASGWVEKNQEIISVEKKEDLNG